MTRLLLLWVGRERSSQPESILCLRYLDRINSFLKMDTRSLKPCSGDPETVRMREGEKLLSCMERRDVLVLMDEGGKQVSSLELAKLIQDRRERACPRMVFVIGGAMGLSRSLRVRADLVLSLSKMTLPHALARAILCEQIYRAMCITARHPYHHEA